MIMDDGNWHTTSDRVSNTYWIVQLWHGDHIVQGEVVRSQDAAIDMERLLMGRRPRPRTKPEDVHLHFMIHDGTNGYSATIYGNDLILSVSLFGFYTWEEAVSWAKDRMAWWQRAFERDPYRFDRKQEAERN